MLKVTSERLAIGLLFIVIALLACFAPTQSDTWWHLRGGLDIWRTGTVSLQDTYSSTAAGRLWPNHEWLTEVIFYALFRIAGLPLLTAVCAALIVGAWALSWRLTEGAFEIRFLLFGASLFVAASSWAIRPQVFSLAAFALTCTLLAAKRLGWLPLLFVLWTNLHGAVALGLVAIAAALGGTLIVHRKLPRSLIVTAVACVLATAVSPLGFRLWPEIYASIERSRVNQLIEWQPPGFSPGFWPFWGLVVALPLAVAIWWRRLDERTTTLVAISLAVLPLAVSSMRNVAVFLLAAVPALTALTRRRDRIEQPARTAGEHERINAAILGAAATIAAVIVGFGWHAPAPSLGWRPITAEAAAAIAGCGQPLYNTYGQGGVLIWFVPDQKVFIDNRQDPYPIDLLRTNHQLELDGNYISIFNQYGIQCAAVPPDSPITAGLRKDISWSLTYADEHWTVFTRRREG